MPDVKVGDKITARVKRMERFGLFLSIEEGKKDGLMTPANMGLEGPATESEYSMGQEIEVRPSPFYLNFLSTPLERIWKDR